MPVGTQGTVKGLLPDQIAATGAQCILGNTYHLMLRPGEKDRRRARRSAQIHGLAGIRSSPIAAGIRSFHCPTSMRSTIHGVTFKSHIDGRMVTLTPERSIRFRTISAPTSSWHSMNAPIRAGRRIISTARSIAPFAGPSNVSKPTREPDDQSLFGIVQGGTDECCGPTVLKQAGGDEFSRLCRRRAGGRRRDSTR